MQLSSKQAFRMELLHWYSMSTFVVTFRAVYKFPWALPTWLAQVPGGNRWLKAGVKSKISFFFLYFFHHLVSAPGMVVQCLVDAHCLQMMSSSSTGSPWVIPGLAPGLKAAQWQPWLRTAKSTAESSIVERRSKAAWYTESLTLISSRPGIWPL